MRSIEVVFQVCNSLSPLWLPLIFFHYQFPKCFICNSKMKHETDTVKNATVSVVWAFSRVIYTTFLLLLKKISSVCFNTSDAPCPMECRATEDLSESDVLLVDKQLNARGRRLSAAFVLCLTQILSAKIFVCQGQSNSKK